MNQQMEEEIWQNDTTQCNLYIPGHAWRAENWVIRFLGVQENKLKTMTISKNTRFHDKGVASISKKLNLSNKKTQREDTKGKEKQLARAGRRLFGAFDEYTIRRGIWEQNLRPYTVASRLYISTVQPVRVLPSQLTDLIVTPT